jgi:hypothetical protein
MRYETAGWERRRVMNLLNRKKFAAVDKQPFGERNSGGFLLRCFIVVLKTVLKCLTGLIIFIATVIWSLTGSLIKVISVLVLASGAALFVSLLNPAPATIAFFAVLLWGLSKM